MSCRHCADNLARQHNGVRWVHPHHGDDIVCGFQEEIGREGDWIQTWTGRQFWAREPRPEDFHILDIAAGMRNPRYSNQCILTETVGEHSVLMWLEARRRGYDARLRRGVLLHDCSEPYLIDMPRPIKRDMPEYLDIEDRIMRAAAVRFDFDWPMPCEVKELDNRILNDELAQNMAPMVAPWRQLDGGPLGITLGNWAPEIAFIRFLHACAVERLI